MDLLNLRCLKDIQLEMLGLAFNIEIFALERDRGYRARFEIRFRELDVESSSVHSYILYLLNTFSLSSTVLEIQW